MVQHTLSFSHGELSLSHTLINGQCFHWTALSTHSWIGVIDRYVLRMQQRDDTSIQYECLNGDANSSTHMQGVERTLTDYLNLSSSSCEMFLLSQCHDPMRAMIQCPGVRVLRQDPWECLISFLCSSNNHISRITGMLQRLRQRYGTPLIAETYYQFPTLDQLAQATEADLRDLGFGYRAKYIVGTVKQLQVLGGRAWLLQLRDKTLYSDEQVLEQLQQFAGVGPKVAACVALYSLDRLNLVPMDVHMNRIVARHYKSLEHYVKLYAPYAGWMQCIQFTAQVFASAPAKRKRKPKSSCSMEEREEREERVEHDTLFQHALV